MASNSYPPLDVSNTRITAFSPDRSGIVDSRRSASRPSTLTRIEPSWGKRRSAISILPRIFRREISAGCSRGGTLS